MGNALCGMLFGAVLFLGGLAAITYNEGNNVHTQCAIFEARKSVVEAPCSLESAKEGSLIHVSCGLDMAKSVVTLKYPLLNVTVSALEYSVGLSQFQTIEIADVPKKDVKDPPLLSYHYQNEWKSSGAPAFQNNNFVPGNSYGYNPLFPTIALPPSAKSNRVQIGGPNTYTLAPNMINSAKGAVSQPGPAMGANTWNRNYVDVNKWTGQSRTGTGAPATITNTNVFFSNGEFSTSSTTSRIADLRIIVSATAPVANMSVLGMQSGSTFAPMPFKKCSGKTISYSAAGKVSAEEMLDNLALANKFMTYAFRIICFLMLWFGLHLCVAPIALMPSIIPCIGQYLSDLVGCLLCCATCIMATFWFTLVFAVSWIYYRPIIGIPCLLVAVASGGGLIYWRVKNKKEPEGQHPQGYVQAPTPQQQYAPPTNYAPQGY